MRPKKSLSGCQELNIFTYYLLLEILSNCQLDCSILFGVLFWANLKMDAHFQFILESCMWTTFNPHPHPIPLHFVPIPSPPYLSPSPCIISPTLVHSYNSLLTSSSPACTTTSAVVPLVANSLQSGRFWAMLTVSVHDSPWELKVVLHRLHLHLLTFMKNICIEPKCEFQYNIKIEKKIRNFAITPVALLLFLIVHS